MTYNETESTEHVCKVCSWFEEAGFCEFPHFKSRMVNMQQRRAHHFACMVQRILVTNTPPYLYEKIILRTTLHNRDFRNQTNIHIPAHHTSMFQRCFSYNIVKNI